MTSERAVAVPPVVVGCALVAVVVAGFLPLFSRAWASADDYAFLAHALQGGSAQHFALHEGRPLHGLFYDMVAPLVRNTAGLALYRAGFIACSCVAVVLLWQALRRALADDAAAAIAAALFGVSVAQVDYAALTPGFTVPLGVAAAAVAFLLVHKGGTSRHALAAFALLFAFCTYTLAGFAFVALVGAACVSTLDVAGGIRVALRRLCFFAAVAAGYVVVFLLMVPRLAGVPPTARAAVTSSPLLKAASVLAIPMRDAFDLFVFFPQDFVWQRHRDAAHGHMDLLRFASDAVHDPAMLFAAAMFIASCVGLYFAPALSKRDRALRVGVALGFLPLTYAANALLQSMWTPFRTQQSLTLLITVYVLLALRVALRGLGARGAQAFVVVGAGAVVFAVVSCRTLVTDWVVNPLGCERDALLAEVAKAPAATRVLVLPPPEGATAAPGVRYELGRPAGAARWARAAMVQVARAELSLPPVARVISSTEAPPTTVTDATDATVPLGCPSAK